MSADKDYLDTDGAIARIGGNVLVFNKLLKLFLADDHAAELNRAADNGDGEAILQVAHAIKGVSANLSLNMLKNDCLAIETCIKEGNDYKDVVAKFNITYQKTVGLITAFMNK